MLAARIAVNAPIDATTVDVIGVSSNSAEERATMYTPAVTIVAAWIRAETGVGPAIASGSHTYRGICALLPQAPMNSRMPAAAESRSRPQNGWTYAAPTLLASLSVSKSSD